MQSGEIDGYDAIFLSTHKFLGGPGSPGILLMNKSLYKLKSSPPSTCGGGTVNYVNGFSEKVMQKSSPDFEFCSSGIRPIETENLVYFDVCFFAHGRFFAGHTV